MRKILNAIVGWVRKDGALHFGCSFLITLVVDVLARGWWVGVVFALFLGIAKEVADKVVKKAEWKDIIHDLVCDFVGIAFGIGAYFIYYSIVFGL